LSKRKSILNELRIPIEIKNTLKEFIDNAIREFKQVEIYLFGSYAKGTWLKDSDIDLIVITPKFKGLSLGERYLKTRRLISKKVSVELLLYTLEEFKEVRKKSIIIQDASEYWIKLA